MKTLYAIFYQIYFLILQSDSSSSSFKVRYFRGIISCPYSSLFAMAKIASGSPLEIKLDWKEGKLHRWMGQEHFLKGALTILTLESFEFLISLLKNMCYWLYYQSYINWESSTFCRPPVFPVLVISFYYLCEINSGLAPPRLLSSGLR